jgi:hypothetical protein
VVPDTGLLDTRLAIRGHTVLFLCEQKNNLQNVVENSFAILTEQREKVKIMFLLTTHLEEKQEQDKRSAI